MSNYIDNSNITTSLRDGKTFLRSLEPRRGTVEFAVVWPDRTARGTIIPETWHAKHLEEPVHEVDGFRTKREAIDAVLRFMDMETERIEKYRRRVL